MSKNDRDLNNLIGILADFDLDDNDNIQLGTADADNINGNGGNDTLSGLGGDDVIDGGTGDDDLSGGDGNDTVNGGEGDDTISGDAGDDTLNGDEGDDSIFGGAGKDVIDGGDGADTIEGGADDDTVTGGAGEDDIEGNEGADTLSGGEGIDTIDGGTGSDIINGDAGDDILFGGDDGDTITGGDGNDEIDGGTGDDTLNGSDGDDEIDGGDGNDTIEGEDGEDTLRGGAGADALLGGAGADSIFGEDDDDNIQGDAGDDTLLSGGAGDDTIDGGEGADLLEGDAGDDTLLGGAGADILDGGANDDTLDGGEGNDELDGGSGDDTLISEAGNDIMDGGTGDDLFQIGLSGAAEVKISDSGGDSDDLLLHFGGLGSVSIHFDEEGSLVAQSAVSSGQATIFLGAGIDGYSSFSDTDGDDAVFFVSGLTGTAGNDVIIGEDIGRDRINAGAGNDHIWSWEGNDIINGGAGDDVYQFRRGDGQDTLIESSGTDIIFFPELNLGQVTLVRVRDDLLIRYGSDIIEIDDYYDGAGQPEFIVFKRAEEDSLISSYIQDLSAAADDLEPIGFDADPRTIPGLIFTSQSDTNNFEEFTSLEDRASGGSANDTFFGFGDDDRLAGGAGIDRLIGGYGDDYLLGGDGNDFLHGLDVLDNLTEELSMREFEDLRDHDEIEGGNGDDELWTSFGINQVTGQAGDDTYYAAIRGSDTIEENGGTANINIQDSTLGILADEDDERVGGRNEVVNDQDTLDLLWREPALIKASGFILDEEEELTQDLLIVDTLFPGEFKVEVTNQMLGSSVLDRIENIELTARDGSKETYFFRRTLDEATTDNDMFVGSSNNERDVLGGKGDDIFFLGAGRDIARGGQGDDIFVIATGDGYDRVSDTAGIDTIVLPDETDIDDIGVFRVDDDLVLVHGDDVDDIVELVGYFADDPLNQIEFLQLGVDSDILDPDPDTGDVEDIRTALDAGEFEIEDLAATAVLIADFRPDDDLNLEGTRVDETLAGDLGDNILDGNAGNDTLIGFTGDDTLVGNKGKDILDGGRGNDILSGGEGNDSLFGYGREANQQALYIEDDDTLHGNEGNDFIEGAVGNDTITGGDGNDEIHGWFSDLDDIELLITTELRWDFVDEEDPTEGFFVRFIVGEDESGADLLSDIPEISYLTYNNSFQGPRKFADSDALAQNFDDDDVIDAGAGDDTIFMGLGNDTAIGGAGSDTYDLTQRTETILTSLFTLTGETVIDDRGGAEGEVDTLVLSRSEAFQLSAVEDEDNPNDLVLQTSDGETTIRIIDQFDGDDAGVGAIELIRDEDGNELNSDFGLPPFEEEEEEPEPEPEGLVGDDGDNNLLGTSASNELLLGKDGNDVLDGGAGFDVLRGGDGDDIYVINPGDGSDIIDDTGGSDILQYGFGSEFSYRRLGNDLLIRYSTRQTDFNGDEIPDDEDITIIPGYFLPGGKDIEFIREGAFGEEESLADIVSDLLPGGDFRTVEIERAIFGTGQDDDITGTDRDDELRGLSGDDDIRGRKGKDEIVGGAGNDTIRGDKGKDTITGGNGNDVILGGTGRDTIDAGQGKDTITGGRGQDTLTGGTKKDKFIFNDGDGIDTIDEDGGGNDLIKLDDADQIDPLGMYRDGDDLIITYDEDDSITVLDQFGDDADKHIERFRFSDGATYTFRDGVDGTSKRDVLIGTDADELLDGGESGDILAGGRGDDDLRGRKGDDIYIFRSGDGDDIIRENGQLSDIDIIMLSDLANTDTISMEIFEEDLIITYGVDADTITIKNHYLTGAVNQVEFLRINDNETEEIDLTGSLSLFL
ncbi:MAG: hypothetical protein Alpg2KO_06280 [Alphaproteobacteria bacterium]